MNINTPRIFRFSGAKPLVVSALLRTTATIEAVHRILDGAPDLTLDAKIVGQVAQPVLSALRGDVALIELGDPTPEELKLLAAFVSQEGAIPVVVTAPQLDIGRMRELMRIGVADVIPQPVDAGELLAALRYGADHRGPDRPGRTGTIVAFLKSGGGVGATSLAVQAACAVSKPGGTSDVCLLDLDTQFGTAAFLMDAVQRRSIMDILREPSRLDGALLRGSMVRPRERFDLLAAPTALYPLADIDPAGVLSVLETARRDYALTLVDLPLAWTNWTCTALGAADVIALVVQLTVPCLRNARRVLDALTRENLVSRKLAIIANRVDESIFSRGEISLSDAASALGRAVDVVIPENVAMRQAADSGSPLSELRGGKTLANKLSSMITQLTADTVGRAA